MRFLTAMLGLCLSSTVALAAGEKSSYSHLYEGLPFEMPVIDKPTFPDREVSLTDFGAVADGKTLNTEAFAKAIDALASKGGGTLNVPAGIWLTGPITFKSNINLHLDGGALILFSPDTDLYPVVYTVYEGYEAYRAISPLNGENLENIAITGDGVIDGNGGAWRQVKRDKMTAGQWKRLVASGGIVKNDNTWYPSENYIEGEKVRDNLKNLTKEEASAIKHFIRPVMLKFVKCKNVYLQGVLFQNSPAWNLHPLMCENLIIDDVYIKNPEYAQNGDGLDVESCKNVIIYRSTLDVGDDAICIKSGKDEDGRKRGIPTENVIVKDCRVFQGHGGFVVGSEMSGGVNNVSVTDCQFIGTDVGLRFKSTRGRGGVVENIYIDNINMLNISGEGLLFDLYYWVKNAPKTIPPVDETTPQFRNITINNVASFNSGMSVKFNGLPEMHIENVKLTNSIFTATNGGLLSESTGIKFDNVSITSTKGPALTINNVIDARLTNCTFNSPDADKIVYTGENKDVIID
ncbi:glycoside hydrolase family 28 protein [uncultured Duncaniella sp.]|uniref:glycoside hydrolase family 28 protein n=1 Tax=uncultured Duncaniella sp. TaxID=2768039 RepID=UPI0025F6683B|nr:glycoside hydrolase family 28 protein [uncultured Duncaniella sp.]